MHPAYFRTRFRVEAPPPAWPERFVILSAYATTGERWSDEQNADADERLRHELAETGRWMHRVTGYDPDGAHAEPSWAAELPFDEACDAGTRYLQDAIYMVDGDRLYVSYCDGRRGLVAVGGFRERVDAVG